MPRYLVIDCVDFCRALADETRQSILSLLREGERPVQELVEKVGGSQPTVSHHLSVLKRAGLVRARRKGKQVYYGLDVCCLEDCCREIVQRFRLILSPEGEDREPAQAASRLGEEEVR